MWPQACTVNVLCGLVTADYSCVIGKGSKYINAYFANVQICGTFICGHFLIHYYIIGDISDVKSFVHTSLKNKTFEERNPLKSHLSKSVNYFLCPNLSVDSRLCL